jgi:hypothetical protein
MTCSTCKGSGYCTHCYCGWVPDDEGSWWIDLDVFGDGDSDGMFVSPCSVCNGSGFCAECKGEGLIRQHFEKAVGSGDGG